MKFSQFFGNRQTEAEALFIRDFPLELHIRANTLDLLGGETATAIAHGKFNRPADHG